LFLVFPHIFVSVRRARLSWPSRQLLSTRKCIVSYRIVSYPWLVLTGEHLIMLTSLSSYAAAASMPPTATNHVTLLT